MKPHHPAGPSIVNLFWFLLATLLLGTMAWAQGPGSASGPEPSPTTSPTPPVANEEEGGRSFFAMGTPTELYAFVVANSVEVRNGKQTIILRRTLESTRWQVYGRVENEVADATPFQRGLAVTLGGAGWRIVTEGESQGGPSLPSGYRLMDLAGNGRELFALARQGNGPVELFRLNRAEWINQGRVPMVMPNMPLDLMLVNRSGGMALYVATRHGDDVLVWTTSPASQASTQPSELTWSRVGEFRPREAAAGLRLLDLDGQVAVWADPGLTTGGAIYLGARGFSADEALSMGESNGELAVSGNRIRFFFARKDEPSRMYEAVYDYSGKPLGEPQVTSLPLVSVVMEQVTRFFSGLLMAGIVLAVILSFRKRASLSPEQLEHAFTLALAPYHRRLLAATIDLSPCIAMALFIYFRYRPDATEMMGNTMVVVLSIFAMLVVLSHTMLSELIFGRTLGKAVMGLRVAGLNGGRATPGAIVVRNVFKMVELCFPLIWISVLLSPLRQSLSDAAAGTLILDAVENPGQSAEEKP